VESAEGVQAGGLSQYAFGKEDGQGDENAEEDV
jgi:hypothetical protein